MTCIECGTKFDPDKKPGGLFFSRPFEGLIWQGVKKFHLCEVCSDRLEKQLLRRQTLRNLRKRAGR